MTLPAEVTYCHVDWWALKAIADGADLDTLPDTAIPTGTVTFTPIVSIKVSSTPRLTVLPQPITVTLDGAGKLAKDFIATDSPHTNPLDWTYWVSFQIAGVKLPAFSMSMPGGSSVDLTDVIPVASSTGTPITRGAGIVGFTVDEDGTLVFAMSDGSTLTGGGLIDSLSSLFLSASEASSTYVSYSDVVDHGTYVTLTVA